MAIRVLIADDHTLMRSGLRALLESCADFSVVGEAGDGREALALVELHRPDVVLMDVAMTGLNGLEATSRMLRAQPGMRVIVVSMHKDEEHIVHALKAGALGYLLKDVAASELETAIRRVVAGERYLCREVAHRLAEYEVRYGLLDNKDLPDAESPQLTQREREVLQLVAEGRTMQEIADVLGISVKTVETHRYRLMDKLNIHHVTGLVRYAIKIGLVQAE